MTSVSTPPCSLVSTTPLRSIPGCEGGDSAAFLSGPKFSPNLAKWVRRHKFGTIPQQVYRDLDGVLWLGWIDDERWFIGQRLWQILSLGLRAESGCWTFPVSDLTQVEGFWAAYARDGRCAIDTDHSRGFPGTKGAGLSAATLGPAHGAAITKPAAAGRKPSSASAGKTLSASQPPPHPPAPVGTKGVSPKSPHPRSLSMSSEMTAGEWFYSTDEYLWSGNFKTREEAISEGRNDHGPGRAFKVACGHFSEPWPALFDGTEALKDFVDEAHEDRTFEDTFSAESDLGQEAWDALCADLNAVWMAWVAKHKPTTLQLALSGSEEIAALNPSDTEVGG